MDGEHALTISGALHRFENRTKIRSDPPNTVTQTLRKPQFVQALEASSSQKLVDGHTGAAIRIATYFDYRVPIGHPARNNENKDPVVAD